MAHFVISIAFIIVLYFRPPDPAVGDEPIASAPRLRQEQALDEGNETTQDRPTGIPAPVVGGYPVLAYSEYLVEQMDMYLDYLAEPNTLEKLARFQKLYFDELINAGFTEEQALRILTSPNGLPIPPGQRAPW